MIPTSTLARAAFVAAALTTTQAFADEVSVGTDQQTGIAVTIYNSDLALIRDQRKVDLKTGENELAFVDVSAAIRPETALLTTQGGGLLVTEQNFDFDLLTPQKLLEKSVGSAIRVFRTNPTTGVDSSEEAKVLSVAEGMVVLQIGDRIETAVPGRLVFSAVPANLRAKPTLVIKTLSDKAGPTPVALSYLSRGLSWQADYVASLSADEKTIDLNGLVTLTNQSGVTYKDASGGLTIGQPPADFLAALAAHRLTTNDPAPPTDKLVGFAIAGADKKWVFADAKIDGNDVILSSPQVPNPVAARYGWANRCLLRCRR